MLKPFYQITDLHDLDNQRILLRRRLHIQEKQLTTDLNSIRNGWHKWENITSGISTISRFAGFSGLSGRTSARIGLFALGLRLACWLFRRK